jgi:cytochrome c-type biogenesis protein CcmF
MEKPFINILWSGTFILMFGFGIAIYRRYKEFTKIRDKEKE